MSGIVGIHFLNGQPVAGAQLQTMLDLLAHRGPDDVGSWHQGPVGLGHRMRWTTPESLREKLPLTDPTGDLVITADARLDNRPELLSALALAGRPAPEIPDSQLILAAYEKWGEGCLGKLLGDFAFAVWDGRQRRFFCARDPMGVRPFYYFLSGGIFIFASEIKAIVALSEVPQRPDEVHIGDFLLGIYEDKAPTFYQGITRLLPGHFLVVGEDRARLSPYWSLDPYRELRLASDEEYDEAFREIFAAAVGCRLRSAWPAGAELSGGLDSSSVVCMARSLSAGDRKEPLHTFSVVYEETPECDERPFIQAVLAGGALQPHFIRADELRPLEELERRLWHQDEPYWGLNSILNWEIASTVSRLGVRVLLNGIEGDIAVSYGYEYLEELLRRGRWRTAWREAAAVACCLGKPVRTAVYRHLLTPLVPEPARQVWRRLRQGSPLSGPCVGLIRRDFARRLHLAERLKEQELKPPPGVRWSRGRHFSDLLSGVETHSLEVVNKFAAAFGVEQRSPYYDRRLVEFCLALPPRQKLSQGWNRMIVRRSLAGLLPEEVRWRAWKTSNNLSLLKRLRAFDSRRLQDLLREVGGAVEEYLDLPALEEALRRFQGQGGLADALALWGAVILGLWLRSLGGRGTGVNSLKV